VERIGWIGTGVMGQSMCAHLIDAGYRVAVHTRTRERAEPLLQRGAEWADSPAAVAAASEVVFSIVGYPADVRNVMFGAVGVLETVRPESVLVDMSTSEPALALEIYEAAKERGAAAVDAPVSGGDVGARNATLSIMVGGDPETFERIRPLLEHLGKTIVYQGRAGSGQHTKMVNQIAICSGMIGVCEALLYGYSAGLDLRKVLDSIASGAAGSWSLSNYGPRMLDGNFDPGFFVEHFVKDMEIALAEARRMNLALPGLALAHELYVALKAHGGGKQGTHALLLALAKLSNIEWPAR
jgi:3-hydroxyisobutyrate dehydrogenase